MFDMNGRIGDWKFQRVARPEQMFAPLGKNPGVPDFLTPSIVPLCREEVLVLPAKAPSPMQDLMPRGYTFEGARDPAIYETKTIVRIDDTRYYVVKRKEGSATETYAPGGGPWNGYGSLKFSSLQAAIDYVRANDPEVIAAERRRVAADQTRLLLGLSPRSEDCKLKIGGRAVVNNRGGYFHGETVVVCEIKGDIVRVEFGDMDDVYIWIARLTPVKAPDVRAAERTQESLTAIGSVFLPSGWAYESFNGCLQCNKKVIVQRQRYCQLLYRKYTDAKTPNTLHLRDCGWVDGSRDMLKFRDIESAVEYIKTYDRDLPNE